MSYRLRTKIFLTSLLNKEKLYVPARSVYLWTGINEFFAAKDIYFIKVTATTTTTTKFSSPYLVLSHKANEIKIGFEMAKE